MHTHRVGGARMSPHTPADTDTRVQRRESCACPRACCPRTRGTQVHARHPRRAPATAHRPRTPRTSLSHAEPLAGTQRSHRACAGGRALPKSSGILPLAQARSGQQPSSQQQVRQARLPSQHIFQRSFPLPAIARLFFPPLSSSSSPARIRRQTGISSPPPPQEQAALDVGWDWAPELLGCASSLHYAVSNGVSPWLLRGGHEGLRVFMPVTVGSEQPRSCCPCIAEALLPASRSPPCVVPSGGAAGTGLAAS